MQEIIKRKNVQIECLKQIIDEKDKQIEMTAQICGLLFEICQDIYEDSEEKVELLELMVEEQSEELEE